MRSKKYAGATLCRSVVGLGTPVLTAGIGCGAPTPRWIVPERANIELRTITTLQSDMIVAGPCSLLLLLCIAVVATLSLGCASPLQAAIREKSPEGVTQALGAGADPDQLLTYSDPWRKMRGTPLQIVTQLEMSGADRLQIVRALLAAGANPNSQSDPCVNPLIVSITRLDGDVAIALLAAGANANPPDICGLTPPLTSAASAFVRGELGVDVLKALLKAGADPNIGFRASNDTWTPLAGVADAVSDHPTAANVARAREAIDVLLAAGAEINLLSNPWGGRDPHTACDLAQGSREVARYLAQRGGTSPAGGPCRTAWNCHQYCIEAHGVAPETGKDATVSATDRSSAEAAARRLFGEVTCPDTTRLGPIDCKSAD